MTSKEAYEAMENGSKVTHEYFSSNQYLYMRKDGIIYDEEGCSWCIKEPFPKTAWEEYSTNNKNGWSIWKNN